MGSPVTQTFDYVFTDAAGNTDTIDVTASKVATAVVGEPGVVGFSVQAISGSFNGATITPAR